MFTLSPIIPRQHIHVSWWGGRGNQKYLEATGSDSLLEGRECHVLLMFLDCNIIILHHWPCWLETMGVAVQQYLEATTFCTFLHKNIPGCVPSCIPLSKVCNLRWGKRNSGVTFPWHFIMCIQVHIGISFSATLCSRHVLWRMSALFCKRSFLTDHTVSRCNTSQSRKFI